MLLRDILRRVPVVQKSCTIVEAAKLLVKSGSDVIVVTDLDGSICGIVTLREIAKAVADGISLDSSVEAIVSRDFTIASPSSNVWEIMQILSSDSRRVNYVIVVSNDGKVEGVVSIDDLARPSKLVEGVFQMIPHFIGEALRKES